MHRILKTIALLLVLWYPTGMAAAQASPPTWSPRTGDGWVDATLGDIDQYGQRYRQAFVDELTRYYGAPRDLTETLLDRRQWTAGGVYYACALAHVAGQPCRAVVGLRNRDPRQGWDAIGLQIGIAPGSEQFQRLKRGLVRSYAHWARPLAADESLHAEFPHLSLAKAPAPAAHSVGRKQTEASARRVRKTPEGKRE